MSASTEPIAQFDIKTLLDNGDHYVIPIYQRNYAWGAKEIEQLIQDVIDYSKQHADKNYYIGTLVVAERDGDEEPFQTVDGQQRLTTLAILSAAIRNEHHGAGLDWLREPNLRYASREKSQITLNAVFNGRFPAGNIEGDNYDDHMKAAYDICLKELINKTNENHISIEYLVEYLYSNVIILRVRLPKGIDLNHYFEIMNSRGEQLEKHEILKARLMERLNDPDQEKRNVAEQTFDVIWEACSNMEKYVQYGFTIDQRNLIFGKENWNMLAVSGFEEMTLLLKPTFQGGIKGDQLSLDEIVAAKSSVLQEPQKEDSPDRFNTVVNFPNFLLHVLRVQTGTDVALDDKRLIDIFDQVLKKQPNEQEFVRDFIYNLLKCKFLFDKYIIKREFTGGNDRWSLSSLRWYSKGKSGWGGYVNTFNEEEGDSPQSDNRRVLMLLAMFHVSIPSMSYKYWLNAALNYVFHQSEINAKHYIDYLEHIAKAFVFDRFLARSRKEYDEIIFKNLEPITRNEDDLDFGKLRYGYLENNLVFNFTDYLIWLRDKKSALDPRVSNFEFSSRSSVEHYYPQHPMSDDIKTLNDEYLHSFGNLCLISHEKNSKFSNYPPDAKRNHYGRSANLDSLKQFLMMQPKNWGKNEILANDQEMKTLLLQNRDSAYQQNNDISTAEQWFREYRTKNPPMLLRALLGFDDCAKPMGNDRYAFFDFEYLKKHKAFGLFEEFVATEKPKNLLAVIETHLHNEELKKDWCYLFIRYPVIFSYCERGYFTWYASEEHWRIELLRNEKRTKNSTEELYLFLLRVYLEEEFEIQLKPYDHVHYLDISYVNNAYAIAEKNTDSDLYLRMWNKQGSMIIYELGSNVHGNSRAVKALGGFGWQPKGSLYELSPRHQLVKLTGNASLDLENLISGLKNLLKKGFNIKL